MGMAAEDAVEAVQIRVAQGAGGHFLCHTQPARVQAVDEAGYRLAFEVELLQLQIEQRSQVVQAKVVDYKAVELVAVNRYMAQAGVCPGVFLVNLYPNQMSHQIAQSLVVVSFHPHHFHCAFGIGQLADSAEEFPVVFRQSAKVEIGENIAQKDQPSKTVFLQHPGSVTGAAALRAQVDVGKDQRVISRHIEGRTHALFVARECYGVMKIAQAIGQ